MNALTLILADRSALRIPSWPERWAACKGTVLETPCLRTIARQSKDSDQDVHIAASDALTDLEFRADHIETLEELFAEQAAIEAWDDRAYRYEQRSGKCWETSDELRREWDEIRPVRVAYGMGGK